MCFKSLYKIMLFSNPLRVIYEFFQVVSTIKHWLQWLINAFEYSNFIILFSNYCTYFHNILRTLSSKYILKVCNIKYFLTWKHEKQNISYNSYGSKLFFGKWLKYAYTFTKEHLNIEYSTIIGNFFIMGKSVKVSAIRLVLWTT